MNSAQVSIDIIRILSRYVNVVRILSKHVCTIRVVFIEIFSCDNELLFLCGNHKNEKLLKILESYNVCRAVPESNY